LLKQIKRLKDEKSDNQDIKNKFDKSENDKELPCLRDHNQSLLTQIKKLKNDMKLLWEKLQQITNNEALVGKETMTDPIEVEGPLYVKIQTMENQYRYNRHHKSKICKSN
jgi:hypothetical protein